MAQDRVHTVLEYLQEVRLHILSAQSLPVLGHRTVKFFLVFWWNSWTSLCAHSSRAIAGLKEQRLVPALSPPSDRDDVASLSLLQANSPGSFSLSSWERCSSCLIGFVSLRWMPGTSGIALGAVGMVGGV